MSSTIPQAPVRNRTYYMDIGTFQVEEELFRVPTGYLKENSAIFNQMFTLIRQPGAETEGQSDDNPIKLDSVSKVDFERFLAVTVNYRGEPTIDLETPHWLSVLKLANLWGFTSLRRKAIETLSSRWLPAMDRLCYGRLFKVERWVEEGYTEIVDRRQMINEAEAEQVGWKATLKLYQLREQFYPLKQAVASSSNSPAQSPIISGTPRTNNVTFTFPSNTRASATSPFAGFGEASPGPRAPTPPSPVTSASAVRQAFAAELEEIRGASSALEVPAPSNASNPTTRPINTVGFGAPRR